MVKGSADLEQSLHSMIYGAMLIISPSFSSNRYGSAIHRRAVRIGNQPSIATSGKSNYEVTLNDEYVVMAAGNLALPPTWNSGPRQRRDAQGLLVLPGLL